MSVFNAYVLTECLAHTSHKNVEFNNLGSAIATVLCQTIEWDGGRNARESEKQSGDSASNTCSADTVLVEDEDAESSDC